MLGRRTIKDLTAADVRGFIRDVTAGKSATDVKTKKRGRAIVTGGKGTAASKMKALKEAGIEVALTPREVAEKVGALIKQPVRK